MKLQQITGGDMFQIETAKPYPDDYTETTMISNKELKENARPELTGNMPDLSAYGVIYLGYPNWWGTMPMAVFTFLEQNDLADKTIVPYCTHEGSGMGNSERDIRRLCPHSKVMPGLALRGSEVQKADKDVANWLGRLNIPTAL